MILADDQFKWFYWLGFALGAGCLLMLIGLSVGYLRKVVIPSRRGRRVE